MVGGANGLALSYGHRYGHDQILDASIKIRKSMSTPLPICCLSIKLIYRDCFGGTCMSSVIPRSLETHCHISNGNSTASKNYVLYKFCTINAIYSMAWKWIRSFLVCYSAKYLETVQTALVSFIEARPQINQPRALPNPLMYKRCIFYTLCRFEKLHLVENHCVIVSWFAS